ncbi:MAG: Pr6Pr family membrane protein [Candidatus Eremiobacteraeota bacterium]|nr:Pr6Pr family membrane protein [Candidatus Eremiobacteraeota bacterium]MBC5802683.1 Pr6Pr family membrane protein [Candidatus Eremiobacteraeota bacterium]
MSPNKRRAEHNATVRFAVRIVTALVRAALALLTFGAIATQLGHELSKGPPIGFRLTNFFSFFTIESNVFAAAVLLAIVAPLSRSNAPRLAMLRGAAVLYMAVTGAVYSLLLSGSQEALQTTVPWVNVVLHYFMPAAIVCDWLAAPCPLPQRYAWILARWMVFPIAYVLFSLVRGRMTGWYPYPFLNPALHGAAGVAIVVTAIAVSSVFAGALVIWYAKLRLAPRPAAARQGLHR